jgi:hypothetical protein
MTIYVMTWRDQGLPRLVGPFWSVLAAADWGEYWQAAHGGDPQWQVLTGVAAGDVERPLTVSAPAILS